MQTNKIKELRTSLGLTQQAFADLITNELGKISIRTIQKWENEETKPTPYLLSLLEFWVEHKDVKRS